MKGGSMVQRKLAVGREEGKPQTKVELDLSFESSFLSSLLFSTNPHDLPLKLSSLLSPIMASPPNHQGGTEAGPSNAGPLLQVWPLGTDISVYFFSRSKKGRTSELSSTSQIHTLDPVLIVSFLSRSSPLSISLVQSKGRLTSCTSMAPSSSSHRQNIPRRDRKASLRL